MFFYTEPGNLGIIGDQLLVLKYTTLSTTAVKSEHIISNKIVLTKQYRQLF